jgi:hypothetical protein
MLTHAAAMRIKTATALQANNVLMYIPAHIAAALQVFTALQTAAQSQSTANSCTATACASLYRLTVYINTCQLCTLTYVYTGESLHRGGTQRIHNTQASHIHVHASQ